MHSNVSFGTTIPEAWNERGDEDVMIDDISRRKTEREREKVRRKKWRYKQNCIFTKKRKKNTIGNLSIILCIIYSNI